MHDPIFKIRETGIRDEKVAEIGIPDREMARGIGIIMATDTQMVVLRSIQAECSLQMLLCQRMGKRTDLRQNASFAKVFTGLLAVKR